MFVCGYERIPVCIENVARNMELGCIRKISRGERGKVKKQKGDKGQSFVGKGERLGVTSVGDRCERVKQNGRSKQWETGRWKRSNRVAQRPGEVRATW